MAQAPSWAQPSVGRLRPIHTHITSGCMHLRAPCQSHGSNFPTDYPRRRHPREKQLLYPDVGILPRGRNQECSLTCLAPEGFLDEAVGGCGWGVDRGPKGRGSEDSRGLASFSPQAISSSSRGPAPDRLKSKTQICFFHISPFLQGESSPFNHSIGERGRRRQRNDYLLKVYDVPGTGPVLPHLILVFTQ